MDIVRPGAALDGYRMVLVPTSPHVTDAALAAYARAGGPVLYGPRTGSKTRHHGIPDRLPPGPLAELLPLTVVEVASLRPGVVKTVEGRHPGSGSRWVEHVEAADGATVEATFAENGRGAVFKAGLHRYVACWPDGAMLGALLRTMAAEAGLEVTDLPEQVRLRRRGPLRFAFNYGPGSVSLAHAGPYIVGERDLPANDVAIWRD